MKDPNPSPVYGMYYLAMVKTARFHGYALAVHGSMARDLDLIAMPWIEHASEMRGLVDALIENHGLREVIPTGGHLGPHGRHTFTLIIGGSLFIDLTVLPLRPARER